MLLLYLLILPEAVALLLVGTMLLVGEIKREW